MGGLNMESETPLLDQFNAVIEGGNFPAEVRRILFTAFMDGAAAYEKTLQQSLDAGDAELVARVQDKMVSEIMTRNQTHV